MDSAETERAAIVAYLRETAEIHDADAHRKGQKIACRHHADACRWAAETRLGFHPNHGRRA